MRAFIEECLQAVLDGAELTVDQGVRLLETGPDDLMPLLTAADTVRRRFVGDEVHLCSIVNAKSGRCSEDCGFCSQSARFSTGIEEYPLLGEDEVEQHARRASENGAEALGLVAAWRGLKQGPELERVEALIRKVSADGTVHADASLGLIDDPEVARRLKAAGLHTYNHNLETARSHFGEVVESHDYAERLRTLELVREAGMHVCSGGILGMGESPRQRVELAAELREVDPDMVPLNFLNPIEGTPAGEQHDKLPPMEALKCIAVFRLMLPRHHLMVAGGREVVLGPLAPLMYLAGASAAMVGDYLTTGGTPAAQDHAVLEALQLVPRTEGCGTPPSSPRPRGDAAIGTPATGADDARVGGSAPAGAAAGGAVG